MQLEINGKKVELPATATLQTVAEELKLSPAGTAIAVNNKMIPRTQWAATSLVEQDKIVVIKAACGG
ncbi:MAG: sulfur carrier protein ThiS [Bacteroidaceae bacterium]|nr:sulfur carrier protein ThiS [Bacteroidaceae bacterium]